ncbi:unnamed protein product [Tuber melanosporum]|uniref:(Perigord truffle) hypothetical protein n=1 Tax=Tuber melanosporum (strain Mel28) TaxID=656061 RepID=D5GF43_TUBMM|nr:uncharacterized protein GSTUM_00001386001 [Tuber melanosporum]CAZ83136.1 unnamed protein product [Tuber melanosporum]
MHVLVVNDDGPPSQQSSPYIHSFVHELRKSGASVSVVLPHAQRSWVGKAHFVGKTIVPTYFRPGTLYTDDGSTHDRPRLDGGEEWVLVDGTPASCTQIGLNHYFQEKGPIDMVVSGPNYGRNSTALFSLSSGTVGGAMEGALCGKRSVALSYAFFNRNHDPVIIRSASLMSVRLIKYLHANWTPGVDLYAINVPLLEGIDKPERKILYTHILQNRWVTGCSFEELEDDEADKSDTGRREAEIRGDVGEHEHKHLALKHKKFIWAPKFADIHRSVEESGPGNDGWAVAKGYVSITPLKANFMHYDGLVGQELNINAIESMGSLLLKAGPQEKSSCWAVVGYEDAYVQPKIQAALKKSIPCIKFASNLTEVPLENSEKVVHWSTYESIDFESVLQRPDSIICCSYIIRKALIRKHYLAQTIRQHVTKHPESPLSKAFPLACDFELDYAEFLDEALIETYELCDSLRANEEKSGKDRQWWILKPGMSDRGQGIRLFGTKEELTAIFQSFERAEDSGDDADESNEDQGNNKGTSIVTNQLRHFIAQKYIHPPLLIGNRKFHLRTYVLSVGGLKVYVYKRVLALFAAKMYSPPWKDSQDLTGHLTNTCLQSGEREGSVRLFWDLHASLPGGTLTLETVWGNLCKIVAETFEAAATGQRVHFQTLPNAFEIFGLDFMIDTDTNVYLLEVNSYPDFKQTGDKFSGLIEGLFEGVVEVAVTPFVGLSGVGGGVDDLVKVLDIGLGSW